LLLMATLDQVKIPNLENLKSQHAIRKEAVGEREKRNLIRHDVCFVANFSRLKTLAGQNKLQEEILTLLHHGQAWIKQKIFLIAGVIWQVKLSGENLSSLALNFDM